MSKSLSIEQPFRFTDDPIQTLVLEAMKKRPVNSDHFSLVKRIKLNDYLKNPIPQSSLDTVIKRSKDCMASAGFAYGRLQEKNWGSKTRSSRLHMFIPGPTLPHPAPSDPIPIQLPEPYHNKTLTGFQKIKPLNLSTQTAVPKPKQQSLTSRPITRISASQHQAREYLNYLSPLTTSEQTFINTQVLQKRAELSEKVEKRKAVQEKSFNLRAIFSREVNKERSLSMVPVKMMSLERVDVEPLVRNAKEIIMKEKVKEWQMNPDGYGREQVEGKEGMKERAFRAVEMTITKKATKDKKKEAEAIAKKRKKMNWVDRLNQSMTEVMEKTKLDDDFY